MADEKNTAPAKAKAEPAKTTWFSKVIAWFKALPKNIATPFKNMVNELKRVTWPTKKKLIVYSVAVLAFMLFMMVVVGLFDMGSSALVRSLHFGQSAAPAAAVEAVEESAEEAAGAAEDAGAAAGEEAEAPADAGQEAETPADTGN